MACGTTFTAGIPKGCRDSQGGNKKVWLTNAENILNILPSPSLTETGVITSITMGTASGNKFYLFESTKFTSKWVDNSKENGNHGGYSYEPTLTLPFSKNEASKRNAIKLLARSEVKAIVLDQNDKYWLLGEVNGLDLVTGVFDGGSALTDPNIWTLTFTGAEPYPAREVDSNWITGTGSTYFSA